MDQIRRYRPPPNPAKESDSRITGYVERFATRSSWELDALDPKTVDGLIEQNVRDLVDMDLWEADAAKEAANRRKMIVAAEAMAAEEDE
jgi:phage head maturation protease